MSDELQKEIERLKTENAKLTKDLTSLTDDLKDVRHEARDRRHEAKGLAEQLAALTKERDDLKVKAEADPDGLRRQLDDTRAVVRSMKHESAFAKVARTLKVSDPAKFTDLVKLAAYQADGDEPDEARISASFSEALKGRPWLVDAEPKPAADAAKTPAPGGANANGAKAADPGGKPGPGADRGQSLDSQQKPASGNSLMRGWGGGF